MLKLIKHLKPYTWSIIAILILLFGQAMSELALPGYMANIVNVGIQQNGIENTVPQAIRSSEFSKVVLFMTESEKTEVTENYILLDKETLYEAEYTGYLKSYPQLAAEPIYKLNTNDKTQIAKLDAIFGRYLAVVTTIETAGSTIFAGTLVQIPSGVDPFTVLSQIPPEQLNYVREMITAKLDAVPISMVKQYAITYIIAEYKAIGFNISGIQTAYMLRIGGLMLLLTFAAIVAAVAVGFLAARLGSGLGRDLRRKLFVRVESFSNTEFDKFSTASLITRSTNDITQVQMLMIILFRIAFFAPMIGIGGILKVIATDSSMLWIIGIAVAAILLVMLTAFVLALPRFTKIQNLMDRLGLVTREILSGSMVIRAFNNQKHEEGKFDAANVDITKINLFINRLMAVMMPVMMLVMNGVMLLIVWVGASQVDAGNTQVGNLMAFMQYAMIIIMAFLMLSMVFIMVPRASVSANRIIQVLETKPSIIDPKQPQQFNSGSKGEVEFQNVSFRYPGAEDYVLKNIAFTAKPGQTTAIIGSTGSGKSTLVHLIPRFYDVTDGKVLVDGVDVRNVTQHDLRDKIGYVSQKAVLFSGTIESNIRYGNEDATDEEVAKYAAIAQADFINTDSGGYAASVSQGGTNLSGGQKQRLAIARALVNKPEIYIFDDSLSALDFKTDAALRKSLRKETSTATVIIVTQRVSTIMKAENIVVMDNGRIAGIGTHKELIKSCDVYREIAQSQLSPEELA
ncbi:MAG: ABC transporter ATP-binding protein [Dehalococcoidales bacterium]|nr:ABC transporter ATP-binding protein [Dehalococcoidales bacterium]